MSVLLEIQKQIEAASQRIVALERSVSEHPDLPSITANLESAVRVKRRLEQQFAEASIAAGMDICRYRAFDEYSRPIAGVAFRSISSFQRIFSVVYAALKHGRKQRATVPEDVQRATSLGLGYAFAGSVGVVLTISSEKTLFDESMLDESMDLVFKLAKASTPEDILQFASHLGPGPINALYEWANDNTISGLGAEIDWMHGSVVRKSVLVQRQEMSRLRTTIEGTSSEEHETMRVVGILTMADVTKGRFKLKREGLPELRGTVAVGAIDEKHLVTLPKVYAATIEKTTRVKFSTDTEEVHYHLTKLTSVSANP